MYSSPHHSQFYPAAMRRWVVRPRRWATGLTTAALLLLMPHHGRAHDGYPAPQPPLPITLQIAGLQKVYSIGQSVNGRVVVTSTQRLKDARLKIVVADPDTCVSSTNCPVLFRKSYNVEMKKAGTKILAF